MVVITLNIKVVIWLNSVDEVFEYFKSCISASLESSKNNRQIEVDASVLTKDIIELIGKSNCINASAILAIWTLIVALIMEFKCNDEQILN